MPMNWWNKLRAATHPRTFPAVEAPSTDYPTPVDMFERLIAELLANWPIDGWAHIEALVPDDQPIVIQISPPDIVNTCLDSVDLPAILKQVGLDALAGVAAQVNDNDRTLWRLPDATPAELAQVVHALLARHNELGDHYQTRGWLEA